jgi:hypothetical protein
VIGVSPFVFWFSMGLLFFNILLPWGAKHDMKKFYDGEKEPRDVLLSYGNPQSDSD